MPLYPKLIYPISKYQILIDGSTYRGYNLTTAFATSSTDLETVWNTILTDMNGNPGIIELGVGIFTTTTGLVVTQGNIKILGQGKGVTTIQGAAGSGLDSTSIFKILPTQSAPTHSLTVDANVNDLTITVSLANSALYSAGDYIIVYSSLNIDSEFTGRNQGELHKILSVDTGTGIITLGLNATPGSGDHIFETMTIANTAKVAKLKMYENITIQGLTFQDLATSRPNTLQTGMVYLNYIRDLTVIDCELKNGYVAGIQVHQCWDTMISHNEFRDMFDVTPANNTYYGVVVKAASINTTIVNNSFDNMRHAVTQGAGNTVFNAGRTRNLAIVGNTSISTTTAHFDTHQGSTGVSFVGNTMTGDDGSANGIQSRSPSVISGNSIVGMNGRGVSLFGEASGSTVIGNDIKNCTYGIYIDKGVNKITINSNTLRYNGEGIHLSRFTQAVSSITNASPAVINSTAHSFAASTKIRFTTTGSLPTGLNINTDYYILGGVTLTANSFTVSLTDGGAAINTTGAGSGTHTITYTSANFSVISDNQIFDGTGVGISADSQEQVKVSGNYFRNNTIPLTMLNTDNCADSWLISDNYSSSHTTSDNPTILGTNHRIINNFGFKPSTETPLNRSGFVIKGQGLVSETYPISSIPNSGLMVSQTVYYGLVGLLKGDIITNIHVGLVTVGTASTSVFVAILDSLGNRLAVSNDLTTILDSTIGMKTLALSSPYTVTADGFYYIAILTVSGVPATLARGNGSSANNGAVGSGVRAFAAQAGQTTIPTTATFSNGSFAYWMGLS